jgi:hypothetical protein
METKNLKASALNERAKYAEKRSFLEILLLAKKCKPGDILEFAINEQALISFYEKYEFSCSMEQYSVNLELVVPDNDEDPRWNRQLWKTKSNFYLTGIGNLIEEVRLPAQTKKQFIVLEVPDNFHILLLSPENGQQYLLVRLTIENMILEFVDWEVL